MGRHRGDTGTYWAPEWPTVEFKRAAPKRRRDWVVDVAQAGTAVSALIQVAMVALIWSGDPEPGAGAVWSVIFGSWVALCGVVAVLLQRCRRD